MYVMYNTSGTTNKFWGSMIRADLPKEGNYLEDRENYRLKLTIEHANGTFKTKMEHIIPAGTERIVDIQESDQKGDTGWRHIAFSFDGTKSHFYINSEEWPSDDVKPIFYSTNGPGTYAFANQNN